MTVLEVTSICSWVAAMALLFRSYVKNQELSCELKSLRNGYQALAEAKNEQIEELKNQLGLLQDAAAMDAQFVMQIEALCDAHLHGKKTEDKSCDQ